MTVVLLCFLLSCLSSAAAAQAAPQTPAPQPQASVAAQPQPQGGNDYPLFRVFPKTRAQIIDLRDMLKFMSRMGNFSLMIDMTVRGSFRRKPAAPGSIAPENPTYTMRTDDGGELDIGSIGGRTFEDVLRSTLPRMSLGWGFYDNCLYVGRPEKMKQLWEELKRPLPLAANLGPKVNAEFHEIDVNSIFNILETYAGIGIKGADSLTQRMSLRAIEMPWDRVLKAVVFMNDLRMVVTDFSITVTR